jgi:hypothetical protein
MGPYRPVNEAGVVLDGNELYCVKLVEQRPGDRYTALGFVDMGDENHLVGKLSHPITLRIDKGNVWLDTAKR